MNRRVTDRLGELRSRPARLLDEWRRGSRARVRRPRAVSRTATVAAIETRLLGDRAPYPTEWRTGTLHVAGNDLHWLAARASSGIDDLDLRALGIRCLATRAVQSHERRDVRANRFRILELRDASKLRIVLAVPSERVAFVCSTIGS